MGVLLQVQVNKGKQPRGFQDLSDVVEKNSERIINQTQETTEGKNADLDENRLQPRSNS